MKKSLLTIPMVMSCLVPTMTQAYTLTIQSELNLNQIEPKYTAALISCSASQLNGHSDRGQTYAPLIANSTNAGIDITIDATKPLLEYDSIECTVQLCRTEGDSGSCSRPNAPHDFDDTQPHRISHSQSLADSLLMVVPPPSYQMAGQNKSSNSANRSAKKSGGGKNRGKQAANSTIGGTAGDVNTIQGYGELGAAIVKVGKAIATKNVAELGFALTDLTMNGTGVATNAAFGAADSNAIGIVGDVAGLGLGFASAAVSATGGAALPLIATLTGAMALGDKINKELDKNFDSPIQRALDAVFRDEEEEPEGYKEAVEASEAREAAQAADAQRVAEAAFRAGNPSDQPSEQSDGDAPPSQGSAADKPPAGGGGSQPATNTEEQQENTPSGGASTSAAQPEHQNGQGNANTNLGEGDSNPQWTVIAREEEDGKTSITWTLTGTPIDSNGNNQDGIYTTEYSNDGTYTVSDMWGNEVSSGTGKPSDNVVPGATTTETSDDGTEAQFGSSSGDESGGGEPPKEDGDDSKGGDGCSQEGGDCKGDDDKEPADNEEVPPTDAETTDKGTPTPDGDDDRSAGLAWAMQNPDNPFARQILKDAATAIIENAGYCQLGCSDAEAEGGLLWAMMNPGNPLAQTILANAAQAIADNSGGGQTGGVDDNPAHESNEGVSEQDLMRIELIIAGGGVIDPPEASGSGSGSGSAPDSPLTGGVGPVPSGPINSDNLELHQLQGGARLDDGGPDDPADPEDLQLKLNNSGRIR